MSFQKRLRPKSIPDADAGHVRIKVQACGVCPSNVLTNEGLWPGIQYLRVPGHEVVGIVDEVGAGVPAWKKGQRAGVGWRGSTSRNIGTMWGTPRWEMFDPFQTHGQMWATRLGV